MTSKTLCDKTEIYVQIDENFSTMRPLPIAALQALDAVVTHKGFRRAAAELGLSPSALSHSIRSLEEQLGVRLLNRTTRSLSPTEAGSGLLLRMRPALEELRSALAETAAARDQLQGIVRLNVPRLAAALVLGPGLAAFAQQNSEVQIYVTVDDGITDIVAGGYDAGMRLGERLDADMIAVQVGPPIRLLAAASTEYLAAKGTPQHPRDLANHHCLRYRYPSSGAVYDWEFERDGEVLEVSVTGPVTSCDQDLLIRVAAGGGGIVFTAEGLMADLLSTGRLIPLLEDWCPSFAGFYLYYPSRRQIPRTVQALVQFLRRI